jgi:hypothetical protein
MVIGRESLFIREWKEILDSTMFEGATFISHTSAERLYWP